MRRGKCAVPVILMMIFAFPALAFTKTNADDFGGFLNYEKCSLEIEGLKLYVSDSKITVNSGEAIEIKLFWLNSSYFERNLAQRFYSIGINGENDKLVLTVSQQKQKEESEKQAKNNENLETPPENLVFKLISRTYNPGLWIQPNETAEDSIAIQRRDIKVC